MIRCGVRRQISKWINNKNEIVDPGRKTKLSQSVHDVTTTAVVEARPDRFHRQVPQRSRLTADVVVEPFYLGRSHRHRPTSRFRRPIAVADQVCEEVPSEVGVVLGQRTKFPLNTARLRVRGSFGRRHRRRRRHRILSNTASIYQSTTVIF